MEVHLYKMFRHLTPTPYGYTCVFLIDQELTNFYRGPDSIYLGYVGHMVSVAATQLCYSSVQKQLQKKMWTQISVAMFQ